MMLKGVKYILGGLVEEGGRGKRGRGEFSPPKLRQQIRSKRRTFSEQSYFCQTFPCGEGSWGKKIVHEMMFHESIE